MPAEETAMPGNGVAVADFCDPNAYGLRFQDGMPRLDCRSSPCPEAAFLSPENRLQKINP